MIITGAASTVACATRKQSMSQILGRSPSPSIVSDDDCRRPAKKTKVVTGGDGGEGENTPSTTKTRMNPLEARRMQNRESARKARLRKKQKEQDIRVDIAFYTRGEFHQIVYKPS